MTSALHPTAEDGRTNAGFEEMMFALSRPGTIRMLPTAGMAAVADAILDNECTFAAVDDADLEATLLRTGARAVPQADAEYVFAMLDTAQKVAAISRLRVGTLTYPDDGATLFVPAQFGVGQSVRLSGPGIKDSVTIAIAGVDPSFWALREKALHYPLGFDVFFIDGSRVVGLPRSTKIEVL